MPGATARPPAFELRVPTDADAEAWFALFDDAEVMRYIGDGRVQPLDWYRAFVARQQALAAETGLCLFSVVRTDVASTEGVHADVARTDVVRTDVARTGVARTDVPTAGTTPGASAEVGTVAGFAGFQPWTQPWGPTGRLEIGWRLGAAHQGIGLATSAARLCLTRAISRGIRNPIAMIDADNAASIAVARKLGMTPESEHRSPSGARVFAYSFGNPT